ncbi:optineurin isoform X2 [Lates japonicus]|uniref:Optineurin n=1 Tax=Lates japonicus TaxID=270547 RepID=A0AAD3M5V9_LATJO|nr:optineurin isoform X2 [Lates japonicus]
MEAPPAGSPPCSRESRGLYHRFKPLSAILYTHHPPTRTATAQPLTLIEDACPRDDGDISALPVSLSTLEETTQQMNILIQENRMKSTSEASARSLRLQAKERPGIASDSELQLKAGRTLGMTRCRDHQGLVRELEERKVMWESTQMTETKEEDSRRRRCREVEQDVVTLKAQLVEKQAIQSENDRLKLQLDSMQAQSQMEQKKAGEERNTLAQLKDAYTKLFEDYNELKEEEKKRKSLMVHKDMLDELQERLTTAEEALAVKQSKIDDMKQEIFQKEKELETISVFQAQAEVYSSDFYAERAAREKLHEEKERLAAQLEYVKKQNTQLQEEMDSLGRQSLNEMQRRHVSLGGNPHGAGAALVGRGTDWQHQGNIPEHACPKCNEILPDLDSLQIHIMDCIN